MGYRKQLDTKYDIKDCNYIYIYMDSLPLVPPGKPYIYMYVYMYVYIYIYTHSCVCVYIYIHTYAYTAA